MAERLAPVDVKNRVFNTTVCWKLRYPCNPNAMNGVGFQPMFPTKKKLPKESALLGKLKTGWGLSAFRVVKLQILIPAARNSPKVRSVTFQRSPVLALYVVLLRAMVPSYNSWVAPTFMTMDVLPDTLPCKVVPA